MTIPPCIFVHIEFVISYRHQLVISQLIPSLVNCYRLLSIYPGYVYKTLIEVVHTNAKQSRTCALMATVICGVTVVNISSWVHFYLWRWYIGRNSLWMNYTTSYIQAKFSQTYATESKVHVANMGPIWGRQVPGGPHVGHMNLAIWGKLNQIIYGISTRKLTPLSIVIYIVWVRAHLEVTYGWLISSQQTNKCYFIPTRKFWITILIKRPRKKYHYASLYFKPRWIVHIG